MTETQLTRPMSICIFEWIRLDNIKLTYHVFFCRFLKISTFEWIRTCWLVLKIAKQNFLRNIIEVSGLYFALLAFMAHFSIIKIT